MAKKMMEITEHNMDLKNGTVSLKLMDTSFSQLTRKIGSDPAAHWTTATEGSVLSKEVLTTLNEDQLAFKPRFESFILDYNAWIDSEKSKIILEDFNYNFTALKDYSSGYIPESTNADYYLMQDFVNAEKELYECGYFWAEENFKRNQNSLKEWSKGKRYTENVHEMRFDDGGYDWFDRYSGVPSYLSIRRSGQNHYVSGDFSQIPENSFAAFTIQLSDSDGNPIDVYCRIYRYGTLNSDGYLYSNSGSFKQYYYNGVTSPHFETEVLTLPWFKSRILI